MMHSFLSGFSPAVRAALEKEFSEDAELNKSQIAPAHYSDETQAWLSLVDSWTPELAAACKFPFPQQIGPQ
jgi:hypothetical protein